MPLKVLAKQWSFAKYVRYGFSSENIRTLISIVSKNLNSNQVMFFIDDFKNHDFIKDPLLYCIITEGIYHKVGQYI